MLSYVYTECCLYIYMLFSKITEYMTSFNIFMQAAEIKDISQKCKQKQDALEMKDKQVRVFIFVTSFCVLLLMY